MKAFTLLIVFFTLLETIPLHAQVSIDRQLYSTTGDSNNAGGNIELSYSIGEPVISTEITTDYILTQGFHQPKSLGPLNFEMEIRNTSCEYVDDGSAEIISITGCTPPYSVMWSSGDSTNLASNLPEGTYTITISSEFCEETRTFTIQKGSVEECDLKFYNAFSPNSDEINKVWVIDNIDLVPYRTNQVQIFNRWGAMVWSGNNYDNRNIVFNGEGKEGAALPDGTYYYIVTVNEQVYKGYFEITR